VFFDKLKRVGVEADAVHLPLLRFGAARRGHGASLRFRVLSFGFRVRNCKWQMANGQETQGVYESLTHSLPLARPSRAFTFGRIPFAASQAAQVDNLENLN
jgi:hypothetical protein